jgi:hypothetical protein
MAARVFLSDARPPPPTPRQMTKEMATARDAMDEEKALDQVSTSSL